MKKTKTCLFITLLLLTVIFTSIPLVQSETQDIKILSYNYYIDSAGYLDVAGEIKNIGAETIKYVYLKGTITASDGTIIGSGTARAWVSYLTPQQKAPFYMTFYYTSTSVSWDLVSISKITIEVSSADAVSSHQYQDLEITSSEAKVSTSGDDLGTYWVSGVIKNIGTKTAQKLTVVATFYNSSGNAVAVGYTDYLTPTALSASSTIQFKVGAFDMNQSTVSSSQKITSYSLLVQSESPILEGEGPTATSQPSDSSSSSSPTDTQDGSSNNGFDSNLLYIIIIAGVVIAVVAALLVSRRR
jgi:hypothetical protein